MKNNKKNYLRIFAAAVMAGIAICIGAVAYLVTDNKLFGAVMFSVGLYIVLVNKYSLFTGAVCYILQKDGTSPLEVIITLIGNAVGGFVSGSAIRLTRLEGVVKKAEEFVAVKSDDSLLSIFILAVFCNFLIFYAVDSYKKNPHDFGKYLGILLCIPAFIISSYEHCVANMCYISIAFDFAPKTLAMLAVAILGNTVGGILVCNITRYIKE